MNSQEPKLTLKQELFCNEYLKDLNATQAAIRCEYSEKTARSQGNRLLTNVDIAQRIYKLNQERLASVKVDANFVLAQLQEIANSSVKDLTDKDGIFLPIKDMPDNAAKTIQAIEIEEKTVPNPDYEDDVVEDDKSVIVPEFIVASRTIKVKFWSKDKSLENLGKHLSLFTDKVEVSNPDGSMLPIIVVNLPSNSREKIDE